MLNRVRLFVTSWSVACQVSLSMEFSRQEYWRELPFSTPEDPPDPQTEPAFPATLAIAGRFFATAPFIIKYYYSTSGNKVKSIYFYTQGNHMLYCPYWDTF